MDWPYWLLLLVVVAIGVADSAFRAGWHAGWDAREEIAAGRKEPADSRVIPMCVHCGEPTMHDGCVCYGCAHAAEATGGPDSVGKE